MSARAPITRLRAALPSAVAGRVTVDAADLAAVVNPVATRRRARCDARHAAGLCALCDSPHVRGRSLCAEHRASAVAASRRRRLVRSVAGTCWLCTAPPADGKAMCRPCLDAASARKRGRR